MSKALVVVESPTKVKTIKKYLGENYNVAATVGHIKDLPAKEIGIDIENDFKPEYDLIPGKQKVVTELKKAAAGAEDIYLAPDPDREGEAIAWHTSEILKKKGRRFHRVLFHELTGHAIREAMANPQELNPSKFEAQQARRTLDRLVGYQISPLLWKKVKMGLSAGRVQSVAVRIICERERAIQAFKPEEYWTITAYLEGDSPPAFSAKLAKKNGKKLQIPNDTSAKTILKELSGKDAVIDHIARKTVRRNPAPPFTTSKLQQEAIRKLRFSAKATMMVAQQLYEGVDIHGEPTGLITYMRTDSMRIAQEAAEEAIQLIREKYGKEYSMDKPRFFKNTKKVQDAHEAIRPTSVSYTPEDVAPYLSKDQLALYRLIWQRFVASQMQQALVDQTSVSIAIGQYGFNASGSIIKFPGFMALYMSEDETEQNREERLPELSEGMTLKLNKLDPKQHFTVPPPRFSEASLVKELEENGIGRPSTYAAILSTIREKGYVEMNKGSFRPSELGMIVNDLIVKSFPDIMDIEFTAKMEDNLDRVESAEADYLGVLQQFYSPFKRELETASEQMQSMRGVGLATEMNCPQCQKVLHIKLGKNGHFLACSGYPECSYTRNYERDEEGNIRIIEPEPDEITDKLCDKCGKPMVLKPGKFGKFLACTGYPDCKNTQSLNAGSGQNQALGVACPKDACNGEIVQKTSKRGKTFYGCNRYPDCDFAIWDKPVKQSCPECGAKFLVEKNTKKDGTFLACAAQGCPHKEAIQGG